MDVISTIDLDTFTRAIVYVVRCIVSLFGYTL